MQTEYFQSLKSTNAGIRVVKMFDEEKFFVMKKEKFIVCPNCKNDKNFKLIAVKIDHGIFEMKIGCAACDWISDDIFEDSGYFPDMTTDMIAFCVHDLHEQQARSRRI